MNHRWPPRAAWLRVNASGRELARANEIVGVAVDAFRSQRELVIEALAPVS